MNFGCVWKSWDAPSIVILLAEMVIIGVKNKPESQSSLLKGTHISVETHGNLVFFLLFCWGKLVDFASKQFGDDSFEVQKLKNMVTH